MTQSRKEIEFKVGIFVTIGIGLIALAILMLGSTENILSRKARYAVHVKNVEGLIQGAKVVLGGVQIGTVQKISFDQERRDIRVDIAVSKDTSGWIHQDAMAEIATQGVLGDKYIAIVPGSESLPTLPEGSTIPIVPSKGLTQFLSQSDQLLVSLNQIANNTNRLLHNFEAGGRSEMFFQGMANTAKNLSLASEKLNKEMEDVRLKKILKNIESITEKINNGSGTVGAMINDPSLYDSAKALVGEANRNRILRNLVRQTIRENEEKNAEGLKSGNQQH